MSQEDKIFKDDEKILVTPLFQDDMHKNEKYVEEHKEDASIGDFIDEAIELIVDVLTDIF